MSKTETAKVAPAKKARAVGVKKAPAALTKESETAVEPNANTVNTTTEHIVTTDDITANPDFPELGVKEGDKIGIQLDKKPVDMIPLEVNSTDSKRNAAKTVADKVGVKVIHENHKGEYFTDRNYAMNSVGHKAEMITTHTFE